MEPVMKEYIFDIEADNLLQSITKIHCLSYSSADGGHRQTLYTARGMEDFLSQPYIFIGHYIVGYDFKALKKIYDIPTPKHYIDTLAWSWYLSPDRPEHGLESYGVEFGVPKPPVSDWQNLSIEEYTHRCETDVEINRLMYLKYKVKMQEIYT